MRRAILLGILLGAALAVSRIEAQPNRGTIVVHMVGFKNARGVVDVALYNSPDGFPRDSSKAIRSGTTMVQNGQATVVFRNLPFGTYAAVVLHDENSNGKMDTGFLGIPKEGWGISDNPHVGLHAPHFNQAKFDLDSARTDITIQIHYGA